MDVEQIAMHMQIDGFCVIPGVIPEDEVPRVRASVERTTKMLQPERFPADGEDPAQWSDPDLVENGKEARPRGLLNHDQSFVPYLCEPRLSGALEALPGPVERGAETLVYLAIAEEAAGISGKYWNEKQQKRSSDSSYDREQQAKLWDLSARITGLG